MPSGYTDRSSMRRISPPEAPGLRDLAPLCRDFCGSAGEDRVDERERDLGARSQPRGEYELVGRVRAAAERPEAVDGQGDRGREMARVAGAAAACRDDRATDRRARALEQADGRFARVHAGPLAHERRLEAGAADLLRDR